PEALEGQAKELALALAFDEDRMQRCVNVLAAAEVDQLERIQGEYDLAGARGQSYAPQDASKVHDVDGERVLHHAAAVRACSRVRVSVSPCSLAMSSWYLSSTPTVACTLSAESSRVLSAVKAWAQSMVSAMPGGLNSSRPRKPWTKATSCA